MLEDDAWRAVAELAASQHGRFTRRQAAQCGISRRSLARQLELGLVVPDHLAGVLRIGGVPDTWRGRLFAVTLSTGGVASHRAAARLHRIDGFGKAPVEITVARGRLPRAENYVRHRWTDPDVERDHTTVDGIPCTTVAATLAQLGAVVSQKLVEQALDDALRSGVSPRWVLETAERLARPGPSGTAILMRVLRDERRSGRLPDSWFERVCQQIITAAGIVPPLLQHEIPLASGSLVRVDLAWPDLRLAVECHSRRYHFGALKEAADHKRDLELAAEGWEVLYMTWHHKRHPDEFIPYLRRALQTRAQQLRRPA